MRVISAKQEFIPQKIIPSAWNKIGEKMWPLNFCMSCVNKTHGFASNSLHWIRFMLKSNVRLMGWRKLRTHAYARMCTHACVRTHVHARTHERRLNANAAHALMRCARPWIRSWWWCCADTHPMCARQEDGLRHRRLRPSPFSVKDDARWDGWGVGVGIERRQPQERLQFRGCPGASEGNPSGSWGGLKTSAPTMQALFSLTLRLIARSAR